MRTKDPKVMQTYVLTLAIGYLSSIHVYRQIYDYGSYHLDITGPLMVITQKVVSLAYNIHDGVTRLESELTPTQRYQAVKIMPTALEYFSYVFHFQALMAGPVIFYRDYVDFIHGSGIRGTQPLTIFYDKSPQQLDEIVLEPRPTMIVMKKVVASLMCAVIFVTFIPSYPIQRIKDENFLENTSAAYIIWYLMIATMMVRFKYYYAWLFADAICNNSGLGRNGRNPDGSVKWDLISNVDVIPFELSLSLRDTVEHWNKGTNRWLRSVVYERVKRHKVLLTYTLSAVWHGFYPGYYLTFASGVLFTTASRTVRRHLRPYFLDSKPAKFFYDVLTFIATRIIVAYITFSFVVLEFLPSIRVWLRLYLAPHLLGLAAIFVLPLLPLKKETKKTTDSEITKPRPSEVTNGYANKSE
ncbi:lysophospholipid acyltransferase 2 isoform X2 [Venturia canescens]|nr:lysophospholipid acyltransferase 2 isoform X2 [Venturia canescens]